ncbi:unnamed protein product [Adineta ricciae]|uniref:G-protein coupled receptors family 1 profile domain-containing protein n=1 Tax=Adineta ricciae TaxID=249248 RepID=A0A813UN67_ADIRI|nr:unnamed protein product [Adineta ricciae]CAF1471965.1 unnamed protein product [Adineta ricciae]
MEFDKSFGNNTIGWSLVVLSQNHILLSISSIGVFLHFLLWFQLFYHKIRFDFSFIFPLCYISTDIFLIIGYFVQYGIRTTAKTTTSQVSCYFEAFFGIYFNILETCYLAAISVCRYYQIVRNENVYIRHSYGILFICIIIPCIIMINMIVQYEMSWCIVIEQPGSSCSLAFNSISVRIWNLTVIFALPIMISLITSIRCITYLKHAYSQQILTRRNHHHQLICRFCTFYAIWLILWAPYVLLIHLDIETIGNQINFLASLGNTIETTIDGIMLSVLDKRLAMAWGKTFNIVLRRLNWNQRNKVNPLHQLTLPVNNKTYLKNNNTHAIKSV